MNTKSESTYSLLVHSQEKGRSFLEIVLYVIFILSVVAMVWQFTQTPVKLPAPGIEPRIACHTSAAEVPAGS